MPTITVYSRPKCSQCEDTKRWLRIKKIDFEEVNVAAHPEIAEELSNEGHMGLPVVKTSDGAVWTGFRLDRLKSLVGSPPA